MYYLILIVATFGQITSAAEAELSSVVAKNKAEAQEIELSRQELHRDLAAWEREESKLKEWEAASAKAINNDIKEYNRRKGALDKLAAENGNKRKKLAKDQTADDVGPYKGCPNRHSFEKCTHETAKADYLRQCQAAQQRQGQRAAALTSMQRAYEDASAYLDQLLSVIEDSKAEYHEKLKMENARIENGRAAIRYQLDKLAVRTRLLDERIALEISQLAKLERSRASVVDGHPDPLGDAEVVHFYVVRRALNGALIPRIGQAAHSAILIETVGKKQYLLEYMDDSKVHIIEVSPVVIEEKSDHMAISMKGWSASGEKLYVWSRQKAGKQFNSGKTAFQLKDQMQSLMTEYDVWNKEHCHTAQERLRKALGIF
jgi:hypothetical protein